jgi:hypothetical protein
LMLDDNVELMGDVNTKNLVSKNWRHGEVPRGLM